MKRIVLLTVLTMMEALISAGAFAQEFTADFSYMSKYVWRGAVLAGDAVFQPSLTGSMGNLSVNMWGNMDLTGENGLARKMNEWDYTVGYSTSFGAIGVSSGIIGYTFPNSGGSGTTELYVGACYDIICAPSLIVYRDVEAVNGTYVSMGGCYHVPVAEPTAIDLAASLGFGSGGMKRALYSAADGAGPADLLVSVGAKVPINSFLSVTPRLILTSILDGDSRDAYDDAGLEYTNAIFGLSASAAF